MLWGRVMKKSAIKQMGLMVITGLMLSACGGGSSDDHQTNTGLDTSVDPKDPTTPVEQTKNIMTFPISEFKLRALSVGTDTDFYAILQKDASLINTQVSEEVQNLYTQKPDFNFKWHLSREYLLTKDKLYYSDEGLHQQYVIRNDDSTLVLGYDVDGKGLTSTIHFKNINLENEMVNSSKIKTGLLGGNVRFSRNDSNFIELKNGIEKSSVQFEKDAVCHQYLTQQFNQPNIIFSDFFSGANATMSQWVAEQKSQGFTVVEEVWAGLKIAYVTDRNEIHFYQGLGQRSPYVVVEKEGQLKRGTINVGEVYDYKEEYDNPTQFKAGICNSYNQSAAKSLNQAILSLQKF